MAKNGPRNASDLSFAEPKHQTFANQLASTTGFIEKMDYGNIRSMPGRQAGNCRKCARETHVETGHARLEGIVRALSQLAALSPSPRLTEGNGLPNLTWQGLEYGTSIASISSLSRKAGEDRISYTMRSSSVYRSLCWAGYGGWQTRSRGREMKHLSSREQDVWPACLSTCAYARYVYADRASWGKIVCGPTTRAQPKPGILINADGQRTLVHR
ncbi:hypothetical protein F4779DRAFT_620663 [Xylariaceae sp. FL0662B]|nr:hypothetical protein F4779DRAFT_620663 [Xylariaceae sp. FL0662B]